MGRSLPMGAGSGLHHSAPLAESFDQYTNCTTVLGTHDFGLWGNLEDGKHFLGAEVKDKRSLGPWQGWSPYTSPGRPSFPFVFWKNYVNNLFWNNFKVREKSQEPYKELSFTQTGWLLIFYSIYSPLFPSLSPCLPPFLSLFFYVDMQPLLLSFFWITRE